jgi:hypothetical protein
MHSVLLLEHSEELYDVTFESPVNKMQDSRTLVNLNKFIQTVIPLVQNDPDAFNIIDVGKLMRLALESRNVTSYSSSTPYGKGGNTPAFFKIDSSLTIKGLSA